MTTTTDIPTSIALEANSKQSNGGKFITAKLGEHDDTTITDYSEDANSKATASALRIEADKFRMQANRAYQSAPKKLQQVTTSIGFCKHTNTKVSQSTGFHNCPELSLLLPCEHPIFLPQVPLLIAMEIYSKAHTPTEQYIAMTAVLVKAGIIDTSRVGLLLDTKEVNKLEPTFKQLLAVMHQALGIVGKFAVDTLVIDDETQSCAGRLKHFFITTAQALDSLVYAAGGTKLIPLDSKRSKQIVLDEEVELERELNKILNTKGAASKRYDRSLARWTRKTLVSNGMNPQQVEAVMHVLSQPADSQRLESIKIVQKAIDGFLSHEDEISRRNSAIVVQHIAHMVELVEACLYKYGFVMESIQEDAREDKLLSKQVSNERVVVAVEEERAIEAITLKTSSRLAEMRKLRNK